MRARGGVFVNAVRATRMPMALTDPNLPGNPIVFANDAFLKLSGYRMEEVLGQQPHFMNGPGTDPKDVARFAEVLRSDQDDIIETVQYRKDGSRFVATVLLSAYKDDDGRVLNHFMSWLDVTRRVDAEQDVADLRETHARLRESEARLAQDLADSRALEAAGQAMVDISREAEAEDAILEAAKSIMGADAASLQHVDPQTGELVLLAHSGFRPESAAFWARVTRENAARADSRSLDDGAPLSRTWLRTWCSARATTSTGIRRRGSLRCKRLRWSRATARSSA